MSKKKPAPFKFKPFSRKQIQVLTWWKDKSPHNKKLGVICDGSIRAGKTVVMSLSFVMMAMDRFDQNNFGMAGKTIGSFRRNVVTPLKRMLKSRGYKVKDRVSENMLEITFNGITNYFYIFGGKDESSQDLIQGITLSSMFFDEVALMPQSFVDQATARCSVQGSTLWFNCNPKGPNHWFKEEWIDKSDDKDLLRIHFTMDDNLSLTEEIKARYRSLYTGVFFDRFIRGLWVAADGLIYDMFDAKKHVQSFIDRQGKPLRSYEEYVVACDYGTLNPMAFVLCGIFYDSKYQEHYHILKEYYYSGRATKKQKTDKTYYNDLVDFVEGYAVDTVYLDPSAASFHAEISSHGNFVAKPADNAVVAGIRLVSSLIATGRLLVDKSCSNIQKEFQSYIWDVKRSDKGEDIPVKEHDHALDAIRYLVNTRAKGSGFNIRTL